MAENTQSPTGQAPAGQAPAEDPSKKAARPVVPAKSDAAAALARAVAGARPAADLRPAGEAAEAPARPAPARPAAAPSAPAPRTALGPALRRYGAQAALVAVALGLGFAAGTRGERSDAVPAWAEAAQASARQGQEEVARLSGDVRSLKASVEALREGVDKGRGDGGRHAAALDRLERADKAAQASAQDAAARLARLAEQLDRLERMEADPARFAGLTERLDRIERQAATVRAAAAEPVQTGALQPAAERQPEVKAAEARAPETRAPETRAPETRTADAKAPDPRTVPVEGWVLRDVYDGLALVESRNKRLHEVAPGQSLPGVGRVEAIERRGKAWFVVTQKGVIGMDRWW